MRGASRKTLSVALLAALIAAVLGLTQACSPQPPYFGVIDQGKALTYLKGNRQSIDLAKGLTAPSLLDTSLAANNVFLSGEAHGIAEMKDVKLALLKYFHDRAGVKYLLVESGYGSTLLVQRYLDTGDEDFLKESFRLLNGTFSFNRESYDGWKEIYAWNRSLPEAERIRVIGIDVEHQPGTGFACLNTLLPGSPPKPGTPPAIISLSERIRAVAAQQPPVSRAGAEPVVNDLVQSLATDPAAWEAYLGADLFDFRFAVRGLRQGLDFYGNDADPLLRERALFSNFVEVYGHFGSGKYYGQFGQFHVPTNAATPKPGDETLGRLLNSDPESPVKGKVVAIAAFFQDCESVVDARGWTVKTYTDDKKNSTFGSVLDTMRAAQESDITLLRLVGDGSPFTKPDAIAGSKSIPLTGFFQYVVLVRNGHATTQMSW